MAQDENRKRKRARVLIVVGTSILVVAAIGGLVFACLDLPVQPQRQADGSTLSLLGCTTPEKPELVTGPPLFRLLAPVLSGEQEATLGVRRLKHTQAPLTLWLKRTTTSKATGQYVQSFQMDHVATVDDENGNRATLPWFLHSELWFMDRNYDPVYRSFSIGTLPRRGRELTVTIHTLPRRKLEGPIAVFRIKNPCFSSYPEWQPQKLPAVQKAGELQVELASLGTGLPHPEAKGDEDFDYGIWTRAELNFRENGIPTDDWQVGEISVRDATGNVWDPNASSQRTSKGRHRLLLGGNLWEESAWRLNLRLSRIDGFAPGKSCNLSTVLPLRGMRSSSAAARLAGMKIRLVFIGDGHLKVEISGENRDKQVRLVGVSGQGFDWRGEMTGGLLRDRRRSFPLPHKTPPGRIRLEFGLHDSRNVVFHVRPDRSQESQGG